jgi:hypothetical protein
VSDSASLLYISVTNWVSVILPVFHSASCLLQSDRLFDSARCLSSEFPNALLVPSALSGYPVPLLTASCLSHHYGALIASSTNSIQPNQPILTQSNSPPDSLVIYILYTRAEIQQHWFGTLRIVEGVTKQMVQHKCKLISRELVRNGDSARVIESEEITVK